jgi:hypothetical protein
VKRPELQALCAAEGGCEVSSIRGLRRCVPKNVGCILDNVLLVGVTVAEAEGRQDSRRRHRTETKRGQCQGGRILVQGCVSAG